MSSEIGNPPDVDEQGREWNRGEQLQRDVVLVVERGTSQHQVPDRQETEKDGSAEHPPGRTQQLYHCKWTLRRRGQMRLDLKNGGIAMYFVSGIVFLIPLLSLDPKWLLHLLSICKELQMLFYLFWGEWDSCEKRNVFLWSRKFIIMFAPGLERKAWRENTRKAVKYGKDKQKHIKCQLFVGTSVAWSPRHSCNFDWWHIKSLHTGARRPHA